MFVIIPTIDAEGVHGCNPFETMMYGAIGQGSNYGVGMLADIFNSFGLRATFFLDVFEHTLYGESRLRKVCDLLLARNQDIQLHTHPAWRDDSRDFKKIRRLKKERSYFPQDKDFMFKCSFEEQVEILEHGIDCLERWTGNSSIAHRAGGYGVNEDTIRALRRVGIPVDSSMRYGHPNSEVSWSINRVVSYDGVVEVPITGYHMLQEVILGKRIVVREDPFRVTGLNSCTLEELLWFVDKGSNSQLCVMNFFMHSYSLLRFDKRFRSFRPDFNNIRKLEEFLKITVGRSDIVFMSMTEFWRRYQESPSAYQGEDYLPTCSQKITLFSVIARRLRKMVIPNPIKFGWK